ncbi:MAG: S9 family peptidase, partial [Kutzneria sp.]|nr:S9 family peptidase [Kutzneria sp.]
MRRLQPDDLGKLATPAQPAISPDGTSIAYVLRTVDLEGDRDVRALWLVAAAGGDPTRLTAGPADTSPAFSPDGSSLAFVRETDGIAQPWLLPLNSREPEQLCTFPAGVAELVWSPEGHRLAFVAPARDPRDDAEEPPVVSDRLDYQSDGRPRSTPRSPQLCVFDLRSRSIRQITHGDWWPRNPVWSPDGSQLAFAGSPHGDADRTGDMGVYVVSVTNPATPSRIGPRHGTVAPASWHSDGRTLFAVGCAGPSDHPAELLRLRDDTVLSLSTALDRTVMPGAPAYPGGRPQVTMDGAAVLFCARDEGCTRLYRVPVDDPSPSLVFARADSDVTGLSVSIGAARAAVTLTGPKSFGEVAVIDLVECEPREVTSYAASTLQGVTLYPRVRRAFDISDGTTVEGWLIRDPDAVTPQPLLLDIHGGPHNAWNGAADPVHLYHQVLAAKGWCVLIVNPRGSDGYGSAFLTAAHGGWGTEDAADFLEPIDTLVAERLADPSRLAVTGYSYGGYATCYLTSRDDRFAAAVAGGCISDLASFVGTSDIGHQFAHHELGGLPDEHPERYARMSPITQAADVNTPTLIIHGEADFRCPVGQAQQWFTALRAYDVTTQLVIYPA